MARINCNSEIVPFDHSVIVRAHEMRLVSPFAARMPDTAALGGTLEQAREAVSQVTAPADGWLVAQMSEGECRQVLHVYTALVIEHYRLVQQIVRVHQQRSTDEALRAVAGPKADKSEAPSGASQRPVDGGSSAMRIGKGGAPVAPAAPRDASGNPIPVPPPASPPVTVSAQAMGGVVQE